ncbi:MAG TPA: hypothetical protein VMT47_06040, partial [Polyangia bacterium]|nr:hypothetical protein [Polyangia bacterium]
MNAYRNHQSPGLDANRFLLSARARKATLEGRIERFEIKDFVAAERNEIPEPSLDDKIRLMLAWFQRRSTRFGEWL